MTDPAMKTLQNRTALVIGASSGVGRATVKALLAEGASVVAVARGAEALATLAAESTGSLATRQADANDADAVERLLREFQPQLVVLASGVHPYMAPIGEQTWETFSRAWQGDTQQAFHLVRAALKQPLAPGSTVAIVSSGAAIAGSPNSGGYAGAKRMQWLLAQYAQEASDEQGLGIRFVAVLPRQLIVGTQIGSDAAASYGRAEGLSAADYLKQRWSVPLTAEKVGAAISGALQGVVADGVTAFTVTAAGTSALE